MKEIESDIRFLGGATRVRKVLPGDDERQARGTGGKDPKEDLKRQRDKRGRNNG